MPHEQSNRESQEAAADGTQEMAGANLATFTALVVQYDRWHDFSDDGDVRLRGMRQFGEIFEMKKALGPMYDKACRDIWNTWAEMTSEEVDLREQYWHEGATSPGEVSGYIAAKKREEAGEKGVGEVALSREQINREMQEYARIRGEMHDKVAKGVVSACDDIYRAVSPCIATTSTSRRTYRRPRYCCGWPARSCGRPSRT